MDWNICFLFLGVVIIFGNILAVLGGLANPKTRWHIPSVLPGIVGGIIFYLAVMHQRFDDFFQSLESLFS